MEEKRDGENERKTFPFSNLTGLLSDTTTQLTEEELLFEQLAKGTVHSHKNFVGIAFGRIDLEGNGSIEEFCLASQIDENTSFHLTHRLKQHYPSLQFKRFDTGMLSLRKKINGSPYYMALGDRDKHVLALYITREKP